MNLPLICKHLQFTKNKTNTLKKKTGKLLKLLNLTSKLFKQSIKIKKNVLNFISR
jgi:hypothetical protein